MNLFPYSTFLALFLFVAAPTLAETSNIDTDAVRNCYVETPPKTPRPSCMGQAANRCQIERPEGSTVISTTEIAGCIMAEAAEWSVLATQVYEALHTHLEAKADKHAVSQTTAFENSQRAWVSFRDAECELWLELHKLGSIRPISVADCHLVHAAQRALVLRDLFEQYR